ncbi:serine hydrolase domain-containing protein [Undibacterium sp. Ji50W]|uniref:serine hydrolase domain-containing protein n=1 Tax=Undibacterium sp. Ji50W TaxID=3413041 RepID=UPI003BF3CDD7
MKRIVRITAVLAAMAICTGPSAWCATTPVVSEAAFPGKTWDTISPAALSQACKQDLDAARAYLHTLDTTALLAVQDGKALFSYGPVEKVSNIASARKSILSVLYGKYVIDGTIDLDKTIADLGIDDIGGLLPIERKATVRNLLAARSGVYHPAANGGDNAAFAPARGSKNPGAYFLYNNWDFNAAGTVFEMLTKQGIFKAFAEDIAAPLQLEDFDLARHRLRGDSSQSRHLAYPFYFSTRDMARIGYLMLQQGNWRGRQIVPSAWVAKITTPVTFFSEMHPQHTKHHQSDFGYGYLWWTLTDPPDSPLSDAYMAWGQYGQFILVIPKRQMVIAHKHQVADDKFGSNQAQDVPWVQEMDFLNAARMLANAPCR